MKRYLPFVFFICFLQNSYSQSFDVNKQMRDIQNIVDREIQKAIEKTKQQCSTVKTKDVYVLYVKMPNNNNWIKSACYPNESECNRQIAISKSEIAKIINSTVPTIPSNVPELKKFQNDLKNSINSINCTCKKESNPYYRESGQTKTTDDTKTDNIIKPPFGETNTKDADTQPETEQDQIKTRTVLKTPPHSKREEQGKIEKKLQEEGGGIYYIVSEGNKQMYYTLDIEEAQLYKKEIEYDIICTTYIHKPHIPEKCNEIPSSKKGRIAPIEMQLLGERIGTYQGKGVFKSDDTIIVKANNKKYLLSRQSSLDNKNDYGDYHIVGWLGDKIIGKDGWYLGRDLSGNDNVIGYITTTSRNTEPKSRLSIASEQFAKNSTGHEFHTIECDTATYNKFLQFCDWQICKMVNSANNYMIISADWEAKKEEYAELYAIIASQKAMGIVVNVVDDMRKLLWETEYMKKLKKGISTIAILGENISLEMSIGDYFRLVITDILTIPYSLSDETIGGFTFKEIKDCLYQFDIIEFEGSNKKLDEFIKPNKTEEIKKIEKELEIKGMEYIKKFRNYVDNCIPNKLRFKSKQVYLYYSVLKNLPEYGEMLGFMAASIKLTFFDNGAKKEYEVLVANCHKKKEFLEDRKNYYQTLIKASENNCLEYAKIINSLKIEISTPAFNKNEQEVLTLMGDYVLGKKEIPQYTILSSTK